MKKLWLPEIFRPWIVCPITSTVRINWLSLLGILLIAYYSLQIGYLVLVYNIFCANPSLFLIKYPGYFRSYYAYSLTYNDYLVHSVLLYGLIAFIVFPVVLYIIIDRKTDDTFLAATKRTFIFFESVFLLRII